MTGILSRFRIEDLHRTRTFDLEVRDNKLILVGENGTGKSTVMNFMYFFLSRQWHRMLDYDFQRVVAVLDERDLVVERAAIAKFDPQIGSNVRVSSRVAREMDALLRTFSPDDLRNDRELLYRLAADRNIPLSYVMEYIARFAADDLHVPDSLRPTHDAIAKAVDGQILFLPTYRRIEQDLRLVFPELDREFRTQWRERMLKRGTHAGFIELVEFGMEDVERMIRSRMERAKDSVRTGLNNLTGAYLKDVIGGVYRSTDLLPKLEGLDDRTLGAILARIPEAMLSDAEQRKLRRMVTEMRDTRQVGNQDQVVAHFLAQLVTLYQTQQQAERDVREFVALCNQYLLGKKLVYDDVAFETTVKQGDTTLEMRMLSSGEKQIVSLFSHIYFSGEARYFVIIDEPELSLSVPWQRRFLPDILSTKRCQGLLAVTHSPFVYDNELVGYARSLEEFTEGAGVVS